jgi:type IX secretion system PorP/SprF family membrane protein
MKVTYRIIVIAVLLSFFNNSRVVAQQIPSKSLYLYNRLSYNPAESGTRDYIPVYLSGRRQWIGVENAPETQDVSVHVPLGQKFGVGMQLYNEATGVTDRTGGNLAFSYRVKTSKKGNLAFGLSAMFTQFSFDRDKIVTQNPNDLALMNTNLSYFIPDASFGLNYFGDDFRLGLSAVNLIETKKDLSSIMVNNTLDRVIYFDGSIKMGLSKNIDLIPSVLTRYMFQAPIVYEGNLRLMFNDLIWIGAGYRSQDALIIEAGLEIKKFVIGYAYDYTLSDINSISNGTHEILIGYQINVDTSPKTSAWKRRNRIYTNDRK